MPTDITHMINNRVFGTLGLFQGAILSIAWKTEQTTKLNSRVRNSN
jgi:hypothetical protein